MLGRCINPRVAQRLLGTVSVPVSRKHCLSSVLVPSGGYVD